MPNFTGQLSSNEIFSSLYNMIISQQVFADNLGTHQNLVDKAKVDGSLYGDTKLYYATDVLASNAWGNDAEATNLLQTHRPKAPSVQAIKLNIFRQIPLTVDNYLSKRAWSDEYSFSQFNSVMLGWIGETKKVYDGTTYNAFIGTAKSGETSQNLSVDLTTALSGLSGIEKARMEALTIANFLADLFVAMADYRREFNDYKNLRSYAKEDIKLVWNSKYVNKIRKVDTPTLFHKDGLVDKLENDYLAPKYFGTVITSTNVSTYSDSTPAAGKPIDSDNDTYVPGSNNANGTIRAMVEKTVTVGGTSYHVFPGDEIPSGSTIKASGTFEYGEVYIEDSKVICKVLVKYPPYMSAFSVATSFFNPKALNENHYLTFGHNTLEYLKNYPMITVTEV